MGRQSKQKSRAREGQLTQQQAAVVKKREQFFDDFFTPQFKQLTADVDRTAGAQELQRQSADIQRTSATAKGNLQRGLAQRGLGESGLAVAGNAAIEAAQLRGLANVRPQAEAVQFQRRGQLAQTALGASPQPTTAAPILNRSSGRDFGFLFN